MTVETGIRPRQCRHRKSPLMRRDRWSYELVVHCSMYQRNRGARPDGRARRGLTYGTNFRHAVEFSRSGRTPSRPFRTGSGATHETLLGRFRSVKPDRHRPPSRLVCGRGQPRRSNLGDVRPAPTCGSVRRTPPRLAPASDASKPGHRQPLQRSRPAANCLMQ